MKHFLLFVCTFIALTSCRHHEDETEKPNRSMAERTVMVYISAENNLSSTSDANLNDMLKASKKLGSSATQQGNNSGTMVRVNLEADSSLVEPPDENNSPIGP